MNRSKFSTIFCAAVLLFVTISCNLFAASKTEEVKSGRLKYVKTLKKGAVGTHGSEGWYVSDRKFYVGGRKWSPEKWMSTKRCRTARLTRMNQSKR